MSKEDSSGSKWHPVIVAVIGSVLGSSGGLAIYLRTPVGQEVARPDPFTGTQAAALTERVETIESSMVNHRLNHPDRALDLRVTLLEANYAHIVETLDRIDKKIE